MRIEFPILNSLHFVKNEGALQYYATPYFMQRRGYVQAFEPADSIEFQMWVESGTNEVFTFTITNFATKLYTTYTLSSFVLGAYRVYYFSLPIINQAYGIYKGEIKISNTLVAVCEYFEIRPDLHDTHIKLTYGNSVNKNYIFNQYTTNLTLNVEGGVLPQDIEIGSNDIIFTSQIQQPKTLSSYPVKVEKFTFGTSVGLPNWLGEKINNVFGLSSVYIDRQKYSKFEGAKIEKNDIANTAFAVYKLQLVKNETQTFGVINFASGSFDDSFDESFD